MSQLLLSPIVVYFVTEVHTRPLNENTTQVLFPRGIVYHAGQDLQKIKSTPVETVHLVSIDWLPACIVERKIVPATQFEIE